jgi:hypothetical protein
MKITGFLLCAALLLGVLAYQRPAEYDEAYSIFLTAGDARPAWPTGIFTPGAVRGLYAVHGHLNQISRDLKSGDVHPPLYFWALEFWRHFTSPSWFAARLLSVILSLASLALIAAIATAAEIPVLPAMALTLLSYGFAYTGFLARGFALAQFLNLLGFYLAFSAVKTKRRRLAFASGLAFGAASFSNYLAIFTAIAATSWLLSQRRARRLTAMLLLTGLLPFLVLDTFYFLAQRNARFGQFIPFSPLHALALLAKDSGAALFGGLPLYAGAFAPAATAALAALALTSIGFIIKSPPRHAGLFTLAAIAPPCGLLGLGFIFHNTPIEIRYLAFSLPYLALLFAAALPAPLRALLLVVQSGAIIGLAFAPSTMQPQARAARLITELNQPAALILLPFGNDGVGIPGPFIAASPNTARIELLRPGIMPDLSHEPAIILANIQPDAASRAATAQALIYFQQNKCFEKTSQTSLTISFLNRCANQ